ncbi:MAG: DUF2628 domain-containing protein [Pseudomonadota bacterium]
MKTFKLYQHPAGNRQAVKQGWFWPGFFFGPIWALVKKMWGLGAGLMVAVIVLAMFPVDTGIGALAALISLGIYVACGINGNRWREKHLSNRGYDHVDTVSASNPEGAIALYTEKPL